MRIDAKDIRGLEPIATGYKIFNDDWTAHDGYCYADENGNAVGTVHKVDGKLETCKNGLHFCIEAADCIKFYSPVSWNRFAVVSAFGEVVDDKDGKSAARILRIDKELTFNEFVEAIKVQSSNIGSSIYGGSNISGGSYIYGGISIYGGSNIYGGSSISGGSYISGANDSFFCAECRGIDRCVFVYKSNGKSLYVFNKKTTVARFNAVKADILRLMGNWFPKFNNSYELKGDKGWANTPAPRIEGRDKTYAYKDMPQELIEYIKAMPEYNAKIFMAITGLEG